MKEYKPEKPVSSPMTNTVGTRTSECTMCKEVFSSPVYFDKHLKRVSWSVDKYRMICTDPAENGMEIGKRGYWIVPQDREEWE